MPETYTGPSADDLDWGTWADKECGGCGHLLGGHPRRRISELYNWIHATCTAPGCDCELRNHR